MVDNFIGKKIGVGFAKETVRWTAVTPAIRVPKGSFDWDEKVNTIQDESAIGVIEDAFESHVTKKRAEGSLEMNVYANAIWLLLLASFWTVATTGSDPYTHTFSIANTNSHQSLTLWYADDVQDKQFPLCVVDSMDVSASPDDFVKISFGIKSKAPTDATLTPEYSTDYPLIAKQLEVKFADDIAWLAGASAVCLKTVWLSMAKNVEEDFCLWSVEPADFNNWMLTLEWEFEVNFVDETYLDYVLGSTKKAMEIKIADANVDLGGGVHPTLTFTLAKVAFTEIARSQGNDEIVKATVSFRGLYSMADAKSIEAVLINDTATI